MITSTWKKSTRSNPSGNCLETRYEDGWVLIRDSKEGEDGLVFRVTRSDWERFVNEVKGWVTFPAGETIHAEDAYEGIDLFGALGREHRLHFTVPEWDAFLEGARAGEFDLQPA